MGVFDDDKFGKLDWMTQMTETIESHLNTMLAKLPERYEFNYNEVASMASGHSFRLTADGAMRDLCRTLPSAEYLRPSWEEERLLGSCFKLETSGDLEVDLVNKTMKGSIALIKHVATLDDDQLLKVMGDRGLSAIKRPPEGDDAKTRMNEVLDVLGGDERIKEVIKAKSSRNKFSAIRNRLSNILKTNEWRIRDMELADKIGNWINLYIQRGDLAAFTNLCKIKVMTHNNMPIYSMEEEK